VFLNGAVQREWENKDNLVDECLQHLSKWFGKEALEPIHVEVQNWSQEHFIAGGPIGNFPTGILSQMKHPLDEPVGQIFFAGTEFAYESQGFIDGAIESGKKAVQKIISNKKSQFNRFSVKQDKDFDQMESYKPKKKYPFTLNSNFKAEFNSTQYEDIKYDRYLKNKCEMNSCAYILMFVVSVLLMIGLKQFI
jgi:hypothetical protein